MEVSSRIIHYVFKVRLDNFRVIGAYGPESERPEEDWEAFWCDLGELKTGDEKYEVVCLG